MRILIVGSGAREHALAWRLSRGNHLYIVGGNAGTADLAMSLNGSLDDVGRIVSLAKTERVELVVIGPEGPLALGLVDALKAAGILVFGPSKAAAQIEASKSFALEVMDEAGMQRQHPRSWVFHSFREAEHFLQTKYPGPVAVKADGLAGGKAVYLCHNPQDAVLAVTRLMHDRVFKEAGDTVVIQDLLEGIEVSVFAFCDGERISPLVAACDYKRLNDGDQGPNTGGMGSFAWPEFWTGMLADQINIEIMKPVVRQMAKLGAPFQGVLYAGLMLTRSGPKVLEFNCRLGDPEAQVILPLLETDPVEAMVACAQGRLRPEHVRWSRDRSCVGVVIATKPYPETGDDQSEVEAVVPSQESLSKNQLLFHGATRILWFKGQKLVVPRGHRVFTAVGRGASVKEAREQAYNLAYQIRIGEDISHFHEDIAAPGNRTIPW